MTRRAVWEATVVGCTTVALALAAAPLGPTPTIQIVVVLAVAVGAIAFLSSRRERSSLRLTGSAAAIARAAAHHATPALLAPLSISCRLRC